MYSGGCGWVDSYGRGSVGSCGGEKLDGCGQLWWRGKKGLVEICMAVVGRVCG